MSGPPELRVGVIGYGVMGKAHCYAYRVAPMLRRLAWTPGFADGAAAQAVCAAIETSAAQNRWVTVSEITGG
jgi:predicted dehydrogenase